MRIAMIAPGSRGDVQPYIALGKGLNQAGHAVRLVTHLNFAELVNSHGVAFWPLAGDVQNIAQGQAMRDRIEGGNFLRLMAEMAKEAERGALRLGQDSLAACQGVDLVLAGMGGIYIGLAIAEKMNLPLLQAHLVPFTPTRDFSSVLASNLPAWSGGGLNRTSHHLTRQVMWHGFRRADNSARQQVFGLPPAPFWGPYNSEHTRGNPILYGFSPSVIPPPSDWDDNIHITGYWFLESSSEWKPSPALEAFLQADPKPLYIGFGSMSHRKPEETADLIIEALARAEQRAVILSGWGGLQKENLPASGLIVDSVPHAWLFPRVASVVHHGGAGTTAAGLRAGVPSLVIPFFGDQPFWGRRVADLGVGPEPIPRKKLTAVRLAHAIDKAVRDELMRPRAAQLGSSIRAEDGVAKAVAVIDQL